MSQNGPARPRYAAPVSDRKLWRYSSLARLWSWCLIVVAVLLLPFSIALQAGSAAGLSGAYLANLLATSGLSALVLFPLFRLWLRGSALASSRLPRAQRASGPRILPASPGDWRRWGLAIGAVLLVGGAAMLGFLVAVLGQGGIAEGVVVGMMAAWGAASLEDVRRIARAEEAEGRDYYAACRRPVAVGDELVWMPRHADPAEPGS